jgi:hypothetical protein
MGRIASYNTQQLQELTDELDSLINVPPVTTSEPAGTGTGIQSSVTSGQLTSTGARVLWTKPKSPTAESLISVPPGPLLQHENSAKAFVDPSFIADPPNRHLVPAHAQQTGLHMCTPLSWSLFFVIRKHTEHIDIIFLEIFSEMDADLADRVRSSPHVSGTRSNASSRRMVS